MTSAVPRSGWEATSSSIVPGHQQQRHGVARRADAPRLLGEELRPVEDERELGQLGGLELQRPGAQPAPRAVDRDAEAGELDRHQAGEREGQQRPGQRHHRVQAAAGDHVQSHEADAAVGHVAHEVGRAVAVALQQRARARGAVDHHRAQGEQAQRRREQDAVLEGLGFGSARRAGRRRHIERPSAVAASHELVEALARAPRSRRTGRSWRRRARAARPRPGRAAAGRRVEGALERLAALAADHRAQALGLLADQVDAGAALGHGLAQGREVLALALAAEDQVDRRVEAERHERRGDVGGLRVVDVEDAVDARRPPPGGARRRRSCAGPRARRRARCRAPGRPPPPPSRCGGCAGRAGRSPRRAAAARRPTTAGPARSASSAPAAVAEAHAPRAAAEVLDAQPQRRDRDVVVALVGEDAQLGGAVGLEGRRGGRGGPPPG